MKSIKYKVNTMFMLLVMMIQASAQTPIETDFTYQGELQFNDQLASGLYDFEISAFDALNNGNQNGTPMTIEAVNVNNGIFTLNLDFGDIAFVGNNVYLEINVRENGSGLPFNMLSPRQKVSNAPYAIHAQFVGADAITSTEIVNGTITTVDIVNNAITNSKLDTNSVAQSNMQDDSVASAEIVDDSITSADIASDSVGTSEIISSQVQRRVVSTCDDGFYLQGINEDGSVLCQQLPMGVSTDLTNPDSNAIVSHVSLAIMPSNGYSIISYSSNLSGLSVYECTNQLCTTGISRNLDNTFTAGFYNSIAILPSSGLPIISYYDASNDDLKVYKCSTFNCSSGSAIALDETGDVGSYPSITTGTTGLPIMSYIDTDNSSLKVRACFNNACTSGNDWTLDSNAVDQFTSIVLRPSNGFPLISYYGDNKLKLFDCDNSFCSSGNSITLDDSADVGNYSDIVLTQSNKPFISYYDQTNTNLKLYKCDNENCSSGSSFTLDSTGVVGRYSSIAYNTDDESAIISYLDDSSRSLKTYKCNTANCTFGFARVIDSGINAVSGTSIEINHENKPQIAYKTGLNLAIYSCYDAECEK